MFYLLYGKDSFRSQQKLNKLLDFFCPKTNQLGIFRIEQENFNPAEFEELLKSKSLFEGRCIVVCKRLLENDFSSEFISKNLELCANSDNIFLFWEQEIENNILALFKKKAQKIQNFDTFSMTRIQKWIQEEAERKEIQISHDVLEEIIKKCSNDLWCITKEMEKFSLSSSKEAYLDNFSEPTIFGAYNPFSVGDALINKNKKRAWVLIQEARLQGVPSEEIFWKIWWQIKSLFLIKNLSELQIKNIEKESNLHPYVVKKSLDLIRNFNLKELNELSWGLIELYHKSKKGIIDFEIGLEKFVMGV